MPTSNTTPQPSVNIWPPTAGQATVGPSVGIGSGNPTPAYHSSLDYAISYMFNKGWVVAEVKDCPSVHYSYVYNITFVNHILFAKTEIRGIFQVSIIDPQQMDAWDQMCETAIRNWSSLV